MLFIKIICFFKDTILKLLIFVPDKLSLHIQYFIKFKKIMRLYNPVTFNEKVNWRKIYQRDDRFVIFADKVEVKNNIKFIIGDKHIIPSLWIGSNPDDIPYDDLVPPYVIKTNNGCGNIFFIYSSENIDKKGINNKLSKLLRKTYGRERREWAYQQIKPNILIEKMLTNSDDSLPNDYKFFVYEGLVHFIQVDVNRFGEHRMAFFDREWNRLNFTKGYPQIDKLISPPLHLNLMINIAEKIGSAFDFVRVDLYDLPSGVYFGETTFYPAGGFGRFYPDKWDNIFGQPWIVRSF